jgi:lysophospholipase L1-like esterase
LVTARSATFNANLTYTPSVIVAPTFKRSAIILGDSRPSGLGDAYTRADGSYGTAGGALNAYAWAQMVQWGGKASDYLAGVSALQDELVAYATDVVAELGANDMWNAGVGGTTATATLATHAILRARYATKRYHLCTLEPLAPGSPDFWATLINQNPFYNDAQLQLYNAAVLANAMAYDTPLNFATVAESSVGSGKWKVDGTAYKYTIDGLHPSPFCYGLYPGAGFTL